MTPWDSGQSMSTGRVTARDQLPRGDTGTPEKARLLYTQKTEWLAREAISSSLPSTWSLELLRPGKGPNCRPNQVCTFVEYLRT